MLLFCLLPKLLLLSKMLLLFNNLVIAAVTLVAIAPLFCFRSLAVAGGTMLIF